MASSNPPEPDRRRQSAATRYELRALRRLKLLDRLFSSYTGTQESTDLGDLTRSEYLTPRVGELSDHVILGAPSDFSVIVREIPADDPSVPSFERQNVLRDHLKLPVDVVIGHYPFANEGLTRGEIQWLTSHVSSPLDLRRSVMSGGNLTDLNLPRLLLGVSQDEWLDAINRRLSGSVSRGDFDDGLPDDYISIYRLGAASLDGTFLDGANLTGAILNYASMNQASLYGAVMTSAELVGANLENATMSYADLSNATAMAGNFSHTLATRINVEGANLDGSNFEGSNLQESRLGGAILTRVNLANANLAGAVLDTETVLSGLDLGDRNRGFVRVADVHWGGANLALVDWSSLEMTGDEWLRRSLPSLPVQAVRLRRGLRILRKIDDDIAALQAWKEQVDWADLNRRLSALRGASRSDQGQSASTESETLPDQQRTGLRETGVLTDQQLTEAHETGVLTDQQLTEAHETGVLTDQQLIEAHETGVLTDQQLIDMRETKEAHERLQELQSTYNARAKLFNALVPALAWQERFDDGVRSTRQLAAELASQGLTAQATRLSIRAKNLANELRLWRVFVPAAFQLRGRSNESQATSRVARITAAFARRQRTLVGLASKTVRMFQGLSAYVFWSALRVLAGYGYRPGRTFLWYAVTIVVFAAAFATHDHIAFWPAALVLSLTSFHGRGFVATNSAYQSSATLSALEAVVGLFIEAMFIATFAQRFLES